MTTLLEFLNTRRVGKGGNWNVTGMANKEMGSFYVADGDYDEFLSLYYSHVFTKGQSLTLLERHAQFSPVVIDLDFRYTNSVDGRLRRRFTMDDIRLFVTMYAAELLRITKIGGKLRFFVMMKSSPSLDKGVVKDGVHIISPDVSLPPYIMKTVRAVLLDQDVIGKCFKGLSNSADHAFDESVIQRNNWFFYGSGKPNASVYKIVAQLICERGGTSSKEKWVETDEQLVRLFSIRRQKATECLILDENQEFSACSIIDKKGEIIEDANDSEISKILNIDAAGTWTVVKLEKSYKLLFSRRICLVNSDVLHSTDKHSCIFVFATGARACCFSHGHQNIDKEGVALWRLLNSDCSDCSDSSSSSGLAAVTGSAASTASTVPLAQADDIIDDMYACRKFVQLMGDELHREGDIVYVFDRLTGLWASDETALFTAVHRHRQSLILKSDKTIFNYGGNTRNIRNMLVHLRSLLRNETFMSDHLNGSLKYLLFRNGIYNIETQAFVAGFDKTLVFTTRINRDFPVERDRALEADINRMLFVQPFENVAVGEYLKMRLARSIAGCYLDKKFICALGDADCSKGTITKAMRGAFDGFVTEWNANNLKYNSRSGTDEAKKLAWIFPLLKSRLAISNECRMDKIPIDGNLLKTLASGGDDIDARLNFQDQVRLEIRTSFMYWGNDMPTITPKDSGIATRVRAVRFTKRFVENPTLPNELKADPDIKTKLASLEWRNAMFWLIMDAYALPTTEPAEVVEETKEWVPTESGEFREILEEGYVIDFAEESYVSSREIAEYIKGRNMNMSDTKIGRVLAQLGLTRIDKKIDGKTIRIWKGIRKTLLIE